MQKTETLTNRTFRGGLWIGAAKAASVLLQAGSSILLARLLFPEDFGSISLAYLFIQFGTVFAEGGFNLAIIQKKQPSVAYLSTVFWTSLLAGLLLCVLTILVSPVIAAGMDSPLLEDLLCAMAWTFPLVALGRVSYLMLQKELEFKYASIGEVLQVFVFTIATIVCASAGMGVWSFVIGRLMAPLASSLYFQSRHPFFPKWTFSVSDFREILTTSRHLVGTNFVVGMEKNYDSFLVGKFLGIAALGYYSLAYNLVTLPERQISYMVGQVTLPALSRLQGDPSRVFAGYLKTTEMVAFVTFPLYTLLAIIAPHFVSMIYGFKWAPAIVPLTILCLTGATNSIAVSSGLTLAAIGKTGLAFKYNLLRFLLLLVTLPLGLTWGLEGVAAFYAMNSLLLFITGPMLVAHQTGCDWRDYFARVWPAIQGCLAMGAAYGLFKFMELVAHINIRGELFLVPIACVLAYFAWMQQYHRRIPTELINMIQNVSAKPAAEQAAA